jgi:MOSC domain-containing protein YiiM
MSGRLIGIARAAHLRSPMQELGTAQISVANGIEGDARGMKPRRQVTVLFREGWEAACREIDSQLPWTTRRANLYVEGVRFPREAGWRLRIGDVVLEVTQETSPCELMERAHAGLRNAMTPDWRGGVCCSVVHGGEIQLGSAVEQVG